MKKLPSILSLLALATSGLLLHGRAEAGLIPAGVLGSEQTSIGYFAATGEVFVVAPLSTELTSIRLASEGAIFTGDPAQHLLLAPAGFDIDEDGTIFKSTFGSSFGSLSFGNVAQTGLTEAFLLNDFTVTGSLAGGGDLGSVDLIFVPEPMSLGLAFFGALWIGLGRTHGKRAQVGINERNLNSSDVT